MKKHGAFAALLLVSACGGGDGGSGGGSGTPTPQNRAPVLTSATTLAVDENVAGTVFTATATDADNDPVTFQVAGTDAALFAMAADGKLSFRAAPDFETPGDANRDNVYDIEVVASDGKAQTRSALTITVRNVKDTVTVQHIGGIPGPAAAMSMSIEQPGWLYLANANRRVYLYDPGSNTYFARGVLPDGGGRNQLLAMTAGDAYLGGRYGIYAIHQTTGGQLLLERFEYSSNAGTWSAYSQVVLSGSVIDPATVARASLTRVGVNEYYAAFGDGSGNGEPGNAAQGGNEAVATGSLFRFRTVDDPNAGASLTFFDKTRLAFGIHAPGGLSAIDGSLLFVDQGATVADEIDVVSTAATGANLGWPFFEATKPVRPAAPLTTAPQLESLRSASSPLTTGTVYAGVDNGLDRSYIFATESGAIRTIALSSLFAAGTRGLADSIDRTAQFKVAGMTIDRPVAFTQGGGGEIYILDADGELYVARIS